MDNATAAPETKQKVSIAEQFRDTIASLVHDPFCKRPGCFGRGYMGVIKIKNDDGTFVDMLQFCKCARVEETKLIQMSAQMAAMQSELKNLAAANALFARRLIAQAEDLRMIYSHTFWGAPRTILAEIYLRLRHSWKSISTKSNKEEILQPSYSDRVEPTKP